MGIDICLHKYNWDELISKLKSIGIDDIKKLEQMLLAFGEKCNNSYYLLNNEQWEDFNSYYLLSELIDEYFKIEDSFDIFMDSGERLDMSKEKAEVMEEIGLNDPI